MKRLLSVVVVLGCEAGIQLHAPVPPSIVVAATAGGEAATTVATPPEGEAAGGGPSCVGDVHCMQPDDVIVCDDGYNCYLAHTMTQPSAQSNNQGQFLLSNG